MLKTPYSYERPYLYNNCTILVVYNKCTVRNAFFLDRSVCSVQLPQGWHVFIIYNIYDLAL